MKVKSNKEHFNNFGKLNIREFDIVIKTLSSAELMFFCRLLRFVSYNDGILRIDGNGNHKPFFNIEDISKALGDKDYRTCYRYIKILLEKKLLYKIYYNGQYAYICNSKIFIRTRPQNYVKTDDEKLRNTKNYKKWRQDVFKRDSYMCRCCGPQNNLEVHHIEPYVRSKELRTSLSNGITLCDKCHSVKFEDSFHGVYGVFNNNKEQLQEYIDNKRHLLGLQKINI